MQDPLDALTNQQSAIVHRRQLRTCGVTHSRTLAHVRARRWQEVGPVVIALHSGPLTPRQRQWAALLNAGNRAALAGRTALELAGLRGWEAGSVQLVVPRGVTPAALGGIPVRVHQTRRDSSGQLLLIGAPTRTPIERSAIDAASWEPNPRACAGLLAAVVQQKLSTAPRLLAALESAGHVRRRQLMKLTLGDVAGGAQALSEIDFGQLCRRFGLRVTSRQAIRLDGQGRRRYLDGLVSDGQRGSVAFEVDGGLHLRVLSYWDDMDRSNELVIAGHSLLRFPSLIVRTEPERVVDQLRRALDRPPSS